jgi:hypothetical protein
MASSDPPAQPQEALSTIRRSLLYTALGLAVFCQALDNTIIATAIPRITDEFQSLNDVGWWVCCVCVEAAPCTRTWPGVQTY